MIKHTHSVHLIKVVLPIVVSSVVGTFMLFAGLEVHIHVAKICDRGLENAA